VVKVGVEEVVWLELVLVVLDLVLMGTVADGRATASGLPLYELSHNSSREKLMSLRNYYLFFIISPFFLGSYVYQTKVFYYIPFSYLLAFIPQTQAKKLKKPMLLL